MLILEDYTKVTVAALSQNFQNFQKKKKKKCIYCLVLSVYIVSLEAGTEKLNIESLVTGSLSAS